MAAHSLRASVTPSGGDGGDFGVGTDPELLPSSGHPGVVGDVLGSGSCFGLVVDYGDVSSASIASDIKSGIPVNGKATVSTGCPGSVTDDGGGGLADGDVVGGGCGVANGGDTHITLASGGRNGGADGVIRSTACCGGEAPGSCLLVCSLVLAAARVRALVLVEMRPSVCAPVLSPHRSWLAAPSLHSDASGGAPPFALLPGVELSSTRLQSPPPQPSLVSDVACESPAAFSPKRGPLPWGHCSLGAADQMLLPEGLWGVSLARVRHPPIPESLVRRQEIAREAPLMWYCQS